MQIRLFDTDNDSDCDTDSDSDDLSGGGGLTGSFRRASPATSSPFIENRNLAALQSCIAIGIGIGVVIAVAIGFYRSGCSMPTTIPIAIPIPTAMTSQVAGD